MSHPILIVEDDLAMSQLLVEGLARRGYAPQAANSGDQALSLLKQHDFQAVVTDVNMKGIDGLTLCERIVTGHPGLPVLVITAFGSMDTAIKAIRVGAYDFLNKPFELEALTLALARAVQHKQLREEVVRLRDEAGVRKGTSTLLGESNSMRELVSLVNRVADSESAVLITGERGAGKEVVARAIHDSSRRRAGPFVILNCSAVPEALLEAELFGVKGTGKPGAFARAQGGTLFLDELAELPLELQQKLLRAIQEKKVFPVGSDQEVPYDARLLTATHRDLETAVEEGRFREDLYFRINVINLHVPPLRMRGNDVLLLAQHFVRTFAADGPQGDHRHRHLGRREADGLRVAGQRARAAERDRARGGADPLQPAHHRGSAREGARTPAPHRARADADEAVLVPMEDIERQHILRVLRAVGGHRTQAAKILGLDRKTLYRKLEGYGPGEVDAALRNAPPRQIAVSTDN